MNTSEHSFSYWKSLVEKQLKEIPFKTLITEIDDNISVQPLFEREYSESVQVSIPTKTEWISTFSEETLNDNGHFYLNEFSEKIPPKSKLFINPNNFTPEEIKKLSLSHYLYNLYDNFSTLEMGEVSSESNLSLKISESEFWEKSACVDTSPHQNAGATAVLQLAITLSKTQDLVDENDPSILSKILFKTSIGGEYFLEIAKLKALRLLLENLFEVYHISSKPYVLAENTLRNKSTLLAENNLIRSTLETAVAYIGGADAVFIHGYLLNEHIDLAKELALKQSIILARESMLEHFVDGTKGAYFVEFLTRQLAEKAWRKFKEIEAIGGYQQSLNKGIVQREIYQSANRELSDYIQGKKLLIGVNKYALETKSPNLEKIQVSDKKITPYRIAEVYE